MVPVRGVVNRTTSDEDIENLINNRQNGRRRGRGGSQGSPRPNGGGSGGQDRGNRIDNRARGNAAQLHEKYKALARDAQMQGDRVNTEYYLQFADHYFRVLAESRSRFEDQQPRPRRDDFTQSDDDYGDEGDRMSGDDQGQDQPYAGEQDRQRDYEPRESREPAQNRDRNERNDNRERPENRERTDNRSDNRDRTDNRERPDNRERVENRERTDNRERPDNRERNGNVRDEQPRRPRRDPAPRDEDQPQAAPARTAPFAAAPVDEVADGNVADVAEAAPARRRGRPPRAAAVPVSESASDRLDVDRLPPSFSLTPPVNDAEAAEGEKPRRRTRKPRGEEAAA